MAKKELYRQIWQEKILLLKGLRPESLDQYVGQSKAKII